MCPVCVSQNHLYSLCGGFCAAWVCRLSLAAWSAVFSLQLRIFRCKNKWMLCFIYTRKGVAKVPVWRIQTVISPVPARFRAQVSVASGRKKTSSQTLICLYTVEQVCSVVVTPRADAVQKQLLRRTSRKKTCVGRDKVILPSISGILCDALLFRVCQIRYDKKIIGLLVVCM